MQWSIDTAHSAIEFGVRHLGISTVKGRFREFEGTVETDAGGLPTAVNVAINAASIDTGVGDRDGHLRSPDFFDVAQHPRITFRSTAIAPVSADQVDISGELAMHGQTRPFTFRAELSGVATDPWGNRRVAGQATGTLNRKDWGLGWNQLLETGAFLVGEEVKFTLEIEALAAQPASAAA
jgi:polyisoprenoid-binding protein YceI